jgi:hypothetical protein
VACHGQIHFEHVAQKCQSKYLNTKIDYCIRSIEPKKTMAVGKTTHGQKIVTYMAPHYVTIIKKLKKEHGEQIRRHQSRIFIN